MNSYVNAPKMKLDEATAKSFPVYHTTEYRCPITPMMESNSDASTANDSHKGVTVLPRIVRISNDSATISSAQIVGNNPNCVAAVKWPSRTNVGSKSRKCVVK